MPTTREIEWIAGLFEGEGYPGWVGRGKYHYPVMRVQMTDYDVIKRLADLWEVRVYGPYSIRKRPEHKPIWATYVRGVLAIGWAMILYGLLGIRRQGQIRHVLFMWKETYATKVPSMRID